MRFMLEINPGNPDRSHEKLDEFLLVHLIILTPFLANIRRFKIERTNNVNIEATQEVGTLSLK